MKRNWATSQGWLGLWLLAGSWLFGEDYFFKANPGFWAALLTAGTLLICLSQSAVGNSEAPLESSAFARNRAWLVLLALLFVPAMFVAPWPYRIAPVLAMGGLLAGLWMGARPRLRAIPTGLTLSGTILFVQALALEIYKHCTARSHELPWPLPQWLATVLQRFGVNAAADGSDLVLSTMRQNHRLGATWEMFLDPATFCFIVGGLVLLLPGIHKVQRQQTAPAPAAARPGKAARKEQERNQSAIRSRLQWGPGLRGVGILLLAPLLWLPLRAGLHGAVLLHRALRTEYETPLNLMNQFWSPWPQLLLLLPLALLVSRWFGPFTVPTFLLHPIAAGPRRLGLRAVGLSFLAAVVLTLAILWDPAGQRKAGRIAVDEFHSKWEPTDRPMDTEWYGHLSGYNYACLYDFCSRYHEMSRLTNSLTDAALANLDVLILKVPTERFQPAEIDAIVRYVERGGSALLIGEHTDVFNTSYHLNPIARRFGFEFRYDCLFGMESFFDQFHQPQFVRHPVLQNVPGFDFATSCSIDVKKGSGRGVIVSTGLKNSMADYHANNYYPQAVDHPAMRSGAFVQLWSARHGNGRVLAFTDSTIFSNFSAFEPGKSELFLGMLEWLNRRDALGSPRLLLLVLGSALLGAFVFLSLRQGSSFPGVLASAVFGWSVTCLGLAWFQRQTLPEPKPVRPLTWVTIDRTVCDGPLSKGGFIAGSADGFGIFERWILRLGYFIKRRAGLDALQGDLVVFLYPTKPITMEYRKALLRYVEQGGKVLIVDSPRNERSTAAGLLEAFQMKQKPLPGQGGTVTGREGWPAVAVDGAHEIMGGLELLRLNDKPVASHVRYGKGTVVALGFGSRFSDAQMGVTGDVVPDENLRKVFDLQFALMRSIIQDKVGARETAEK